MLYGLVSKSVSVFSIYNVQHMQEHLTRPSSEEIYERLRTVVDPELHIDIVSLGLIYDVNITQDLIHITMTLTTPGCPLAPVIDQMVREAVGDLPGIDQEEGMWIELTFDPPWAPDMMSEEARAELGR